MNYEEALDALDEQYGEWKKLMGNPRRDLSPAEHLNLAEEMISLYRRMINVQTIIAEVQDMTASGEGALSTLRESAYLHIAIANARLS